VGKTLWPPSLFLLMRSSNLCLAKLPNALRLGTLARILSYLLFGPMLTLGVV
jgi:hypothetical protein